MVIKQGENETFPRHLVLSMIFSANSFPVDLKRNDAIRANHKNRTDTATLSESEMKGSLVSTATLFLESYVCLIS